MSKWTTLYGLEGQSETDYDLNHASWPVAAVASDYEFEKTFDFGGMTFTLEDTHSKGYLQLYVQIPSGSNGEWSHTMTNSSSKKALFLYFGDNDNPDYSANGASAVWPVIEFVPSTPTPTPKTYEGFALTGEFHSSTEGIDGSEGAFYLHHSYFNKGCSNVSINSEGKTELRVKRCDSIGGCVDSSGVANVLNENDTIGGTKYANYTYFLSETPVTIIGDTDSMVLNFRLEAYAETVVPTLIFWQNGSFFYIGLATMQGTTNHVRTLEDYTVTQELLPAFSRISADDWPNNPHKFNFNKGESFYVGLAFGLSGAACYDHLVRIDKFEIDFGSNFTSINPTPTPTSVAQQSSGSTGSTDS